MSAPVCTACGNGVETVDGVCQHCGRPFQPIELEPRTLPFRLPQPVAEAVARSPIEEAHDKAAAQALRDEQIRLDQVFVGAGEVRERRNLALKDAWGKLHVGSAYNEAREVLGIYSPETKVNTLPQCAAPTWPWLLLWLVICLAHHAVVWVNVASAIVAPFMAPWYLAGPVVVSVLWVTFSPVECVMTRWEDQVRARLGWRPVRMFVGFYYVRPLKKLRRAWRERMVCYEP